MQQSSGSPTISLIFVLLWIVAIVIVARYGKKRKLGLGWTLVISLLFSPLIGFIAAAASGKRRPLLNN